MLWWYCLSPHWLSLAFRQNPLEWSLHTLFKSNYPSNWHGLPWLEYHWEPWTKNQTLETKVGLLHQFDFLFLKPFLAYWLFSDKTPIIKHCQIIFSVFGGYVVKQNVMAMHLKNWNALRTTFRTVVWTEFRFFEIHCHLFPLKNRWYPEVTRRISWAKSFSRKKIWQRFMLVNTHGVRALLN